MEREILFRGKCGITKRWVYGDLIQSESGRRYILPIQEPDFDNFIEVIPETIGQLMPIKDADGQRLFEGDIVSGNRTPDNFGPSIVFHKRTDYRLVGYTNTETLSTFGLPKDMSYSERSDHIRWVLAGNKIDNPELLKSL